MTNPRLRLAAQGVIVALALSFGLSVMAGSGSQAAIGRLGGDFPAFFGAGRIVAAGDGADLYSGRRQAAAQADLFGGESDGYLPFAYPPAVAALYVPLVQLGYRWGYVVQTALLVGALVLAVRLAEPLVPILRRDRWVTFATMLATWPVFRSLGAAQNSVLTLLLFVWWWRAVADKRWPVAGLAVGLMLFKVQFAWAPLLVLVAAALAPGVTDRARRFASVGVVGLCWALWWATSAWVSGVGWLPQWWSHARDFARVDLVVDAANAVSLAGVGHAVAGSAGETAGSALAVLIAAAFVGVAWRWRANPLLVVPWVPLVGLMCAPHVLFYDAALVLGSVAWCISPAASLGLPANSAARRSEPSPDPTAAGRGPRPWWAGGAWLGAAWALAAAQPLADQVGVAPTAAALAVVAGGTLGRWHALVSVTPRGTAPSEGSILTPTT